ncbi:MAG: hypothetical protein HY238_14785 [Acidobacteria bacterium]|nr:hypothetical protein [Acidobacteriota bacterium]
MRIALYWIACGILTLVGCGSKEGGPGQEAAAPNQPAAHQPGGTGSAKPHAAADTLPAGTPLRVRTSIALSTNTHEAGQTFTAHLEEPLVHGGKVVAPKGAEVEGKIIEAGKGGRVKGRAALAVQLIQLRTAGGHAVHIATNTISHEAASTKGKDAAKIGIGSGVGAAIGAIAGGGKGAAIGAAAGAGAGTGVVLATRGDAAVIPAETVLQFELHSPVTVSR